MDPNLWPRGRLGVILIQETRGFREVRPGSGPLLVHSKSSKKKSKKNLKFDTENSMHSKSSKKKTILRISGWWRAWLGLIQETNGFHDFLSKTCIPLIRFSKFPLRSKKIFEFPVSKVGLMSQLRRHRPRILKVFVCK